VLSRFTNLFNRRITAGGSAAGISQRCFSGVFSSIAMILLAGAAISFRKEETGERRLEEISL